MGKASNNKHGKGCLLGYLWIAVVSDKEEIVFIVAAEIKWRIRERDKQSVKKYWSTVNWSVLGSSGERKKKKQTDNSNVTESAI